MTTADKGDGLVALRHGVQDGLDGFGDVAAEELVAFAIEVDILRVLDLRNMRGDEDEKVVDGDAALMHDARGDFVLLDDGGVEVVIVDDASSDGTAEILGRLHDERLTMIRHPVNRGKGAAIGPGRRGDRRLHDPA